MKLTILIPVYNEEKTIKQVLSAVSRVKLPCTTEIIIIDDGSTDATASKLKVQRSKFKNLKLIHHLKNQGKGAAIKTGIKAATGDYILIQDADLEYNPQEIPNLLAPLLHHKSSIRQLADHPIAVYGSRFKNNAAQIPLLYLFGNKFLTMLTNLLYGTNLTDMETGYKILPTSFLKKTKLTGIRFEIEPEITAKLIKSGFSIIEVSISYKGRSHVAGKKLTVKDAFAAIQTLLFNKIKKGV